VTSHRTRRYSS